MKCRKITGKFSQPNFRKNMDNNYIMESNKELQDMKGYNLVTTTSGQLRDAYKSNSGTRRSFGLNHARSNKEFDERQNRSFDIASKTVKSKNNRVLATSNSAQSF